MEFPHTQPVAKWRRVEMVQQWFPTFVVGYNYQMDQVSVHVPKTLLSETNPLDIRRK